MLCHMPFCVHHMVKMLFFCEKFYLVKQKSSEMKSSKQVGCTLFVTSLCTENCFSGNAIVRIIVMMNSLLMQSHLWSFKCSRMPFLEVLVVCFPHWKVFVMHALFSFKKQNIRCLSFGSCCSCLIQSGRQVHLSTGGFVFCLGARLEYPRLITMIKLFRNPISFHSRRSVQISPPLIFGDASGMWAPLSFTPVHV